ncbi:MAG: toprim domain-containing protein [Eubacteriaceae bacterium]
MVNETEINGFKIDKFNIYNIPDGVKRYTCPLCSANRKPQNQKQKCLMIDWNKGLMTCQHCGEVIQMHTYKKKHIETTKIYKKPEWNNKTQLSDNLVKWFESRKITQSTLKKLKITESKEWMPQTRKEENTVQFNYFRDGELINIKYRDGRKNFKMVTDAEKTPYNLDNIRTDTECIIVEGEIDALSVVESGFINVTSNPNGSTKGNVNLDWLDTSIDYFDNKEKIILALDNDEAGQNVQKELIRRLGAERCYLVDLKPYKDFNELLQAKSIFEVQNRIKNAKQCPLENIVTLNDNKNELHDFYLNGAKRGYQIGLKSFDEKFSTYTKQYIMVTGIPSSGKSDFVDQMCVGYNLNYGWKIAYCSVENKPEYLHQDKICRKFAGYRPETQEQLSHTKWDKVEQHVNDNFFFINFDKKYDLESVLHKASELVKRKGIKCLVLDPFNKIRLLSSNRDNVNQYTEDYHNLLDAWVQKHDCLIILVAHPNKMMKVNGVMPEPTFYDIKGGGEHYDMSYHGLLVHRNYNNGTVKIKVLKVKFAHLGENQGEANFMWSGTSGRYTEIRGYANDDMSEIVPLWDNSYWLEDKTKQPELTEFKQYEQDKLNNHEFRQDVVTQQGQNFEDEYAALRDVPF